MRATKRNILLAVGLLTLGVGGALTVGARSGLPVDFFGSRAYALTGNNPHLISDVASRVLPSVVNIASTRRIPVSSSPRDPFFQRFFGRRFRPGTRVRRGQGSGVIISADGIVVTNNHVVKGATSVRVTLSDKRSFKAKVVGTDPKSDLAVLKLEGARGLKPLPIGDSAKLRLGDIVLAVGNPFGIGQTVTMGIVSAKGRSNVGLVDYEDFIQTDAAINPGNSGGALVNLRGQLVGINTAILSRSGGYQGIGFAIPTNLAKPIVKALRTTGHVVRGYIGVMIQNVPHELAKALKLPHNRGVLISDVLRGGPASKAGLRRGDFVVSIDGQKTRTVAKLRNHVAAAAGGRKLVFTLWRNGKKLNITATTSRMPSSAARYARGSRAPRVGKAYRKTGLTLSRLSPTLRRRFRISRRVRYGVVVEDVAQGSPAARAGLRPGDVILQANRARMTSVRRFSQVYSAAAGRVLVLVHRGDSTIFLLLPK